MVDYLTLLGIETWRPRYALPGARSSLEMKMFALWLADENLVGYLLVETVNGGDASQIAAAQDLLDAMLRAIHLRRTPINSIDHECKNVLVMGETLAQHISQSTQSLIQLREKNPLKLGDEGLVQLISRAQFSYQNASVVMTYHPTYLLQNPSEKRAAWEDLKLFAKNLGTV